MDILEVNAAAAVEISIEAARTLAQAKRTGTILNISSAAGELPMPAMAVYAASKSLLTMFSQSFDAEMRPYGIRVLASLPGQIATPVCGKCLSRTLHSTPFLEQPHAPPGSRKNLEANRDQKKSQSHRFPHASRLGVSQIFAPLSCKLAAAKKSIETVYFSLFNWISWIRLKQI